MRRILIALAALAALPRTMERGTRTPPGAPGRTALCCFGAKVLAR